MTKDQSSYRLIKRYPNRRLYDVQESRYINFSDLRQLVIDGVEFKVIVDKTNEDQTKSVLMHIFLELEMGGQPLFTDEALKNLIQTKNLYSKFFLSSFIDKWFSSIVRLQMV